MFTAYVRGQSKSKRDRFFPNVRPSGANGVEKLLRKLSIGTYISVKTE